MYCIFELPWLCTSSLHCSSTYTIFYVFLWRVKLNYSILNSIDTYHFIFQCHMIIQDGVKCLAFQKKKRAFLNQHPWYHNYHSNNNLHAQLKDFIRLNNLRHFYPILGQRKSSLVIFLWKMRTSSVVFLTNIISNGLCQALKIILWPKK